MANWKNFDKLNTYEELMNVAPMNLAQAMAGENGAERVKRYSVPMAAGLAFNYGAKSVDDNVLAVLAKLAEETQSMTASMGEFVEKIKHASHK